jgi:putative SOS response-associated peptidase YedK
MCGRARATLSAERVAAASGTSQWVHREAYVPRYNAQPGTPLPCVRASDPTRGEPPDERRVESMTWGLVPSFTGPGEKPDHFRMFNARGETLREKPAFGRLLRRRRCVALLDGFYEWRREGDARKQPYYLYLRVRTSRDGNENAADSDSPPTETRHDTDADEKNERSARVVESGSPAFDDSRVAPMRCAALYDVWRRASSPRDATEIGEGSSLRGTHDSETHSLTTCTLVTVDASQRVAWLHDRMPAVLRSDEEVRAWLAGGGDGDDGDLKPASERERPETRLLRPYDAEDLTWHPVTVDVNAAGRLEGPRCCAPARRAAERDAGSVAGLFAKAAEKTKNKTPENRSDDGTARRAAESSPSSAVRKRPRTTAPRPAKQRSVADLFGRAPPRRGNARDGAAE